MLSTLPPEPSNVAAYIAGCPCVAATEQVVHDGRGGAGLLHRPGLPISRSWRWRWSKATENK